MRGNGWGEGESKNKEIAGDKDVGPSQGYFVW